VITKELINPLDKKSYDGDSSRELEEVVPRQKKRIEKVRSEK